MKIEEIAKVCHEANRAYCETLGDFSQVAWADAPEWQRHSAIQGVQWRLDNSDAAVAASHDAWCDVKRRDGWNYGPVKDAEKKEHPCLVAYDKLPAAEKSKDALFVAVVKALAGEQTVNTRGAVMATELCNGCGHPMRMHFCNVIGENICLESHEHTSKGVIMTFTVHCDCVNGVSEQAKQAAREQAEQADREQAAIDDICKVISQRS
jgi:hypothetical protein